MDTTTAKKRKGGAEKVREKKKRSLEADAAKCAKLSDLFSRTTVLATTLTTANIPQTVTEDEITSESVPAFDPSSSDTEAEVVTLTTVVPGDACSSCTGSEPEPVTSVSSIVPVASISQSVPSCSIEFSPSDSASFSVETTSGESINYFARPSSGQLSLFFKNHPQQDTEEDPNFQKVFLRKDGSNRRWLTYNIKNKSLFCTVCLAFSKPSTTGPFIDGLKDRRHVYQRLEEHEKSNSHRGCAEAYFLKATSADIGSRLLHNQMSIRRQQVRKRRQVLHRVIDIIRVIGKCGLSYRGDKAEAAYMLKNVTLGHGNFLELVLLLSKYDVCLQEHVSECIEKSQQQHSKSARGRGSLLTLLSKNTVNGILDAIKQLIQTTIEKEVRDAGMFSIQIDTSQDITSREQMSVIIRYVTNQIHERLLAIVDCKLTTGEAIHQLLMNVLTLCHIDVTKCIGNSTDGAANMQGTYKGFSTWLTTVSPGQIHVWCYSHILNLVLSESTKTTLQSASLFMLLNDVATFIKDSYVRMDLWENVSQDPLHRRLSTVAETRWWSKDVALKKVFGSFDKPDSALYVSLIVMLRIFYSSSKHNADARAKAKGYCDCLLRYETIITAQIFLRIFELTSPLSKYLQTSGMDILTGYWMVMDVQESLKSYVRSFDEVKEAANNFVKWANDQLQEKYGEFSFEIENSLPEKRIRRRKLMAGEVAQDEVHANAEIAYKVKVHNVILDAVTQSMEQRFTANGTIYADLACLDPRNFNSIRENGLNSPTLDETSKRLIKFDDRATPENLRSELRSLTLHWEKLKRSPLEEYNIRVATDTSQDETIDDTELVTKSCSSCKNCSLCVYQLLQRYNLLTDAYNIIGQAYKFLLSLSITQVACERSFSTLKFIKNRLRNSMNQSHLESFMLMATEKDILMKLDGDDIIDKVAEKSNLLSRSLR